MIKAEQQKHYVEVLLSEAQAAHERIGAYTEATQRLLSIMFPVISGTIGFLFYQGKDGNIEAFFHGRMLPYELMALSIVVSLAVALTTHYNCLAFFYIERKNGLGKKTQDLLGLADNPLSASDDLHKSDFWLPFVWASRVYYFFEALIGPLLALAALFLKHHQGSRSWCVFGGIELVVFCFALGATLPTLIFMFRSQRTFRRTAVKG